MVRTKKVRTKKVRTILGVHAFSENYLSRPCYLVKVRTILVVRATAVPYRTVQRHNREERSLQRQAKRPTTISLLRRPSYGTVHPNACYVQVVHYTHIDTYDTAAAQIRTWLIVVRYERMWQHDVKIIRLRSIMTAAAHRTPHVGSLVHIPSPHLHAP